jgi:predicted RNA-binding Zn ribbon-like protein
MALKLDHNLLEELGLGTLPTPEKNRLLAHIYETLELRVGTKIAAELEDEQLSEFEQFIDSKDEAGAQRWLEQNYPNYPQTVSQELAQLKTEIKRDAAKILAAANDEKS